MVKQKHILSQKKKEDKQEGKKEKKEDKQKRKKSNNKKKNKKLHNKNKVQKLKQLSINSPKQVATQQVAKEIQRLKVLTVR